MEFVHHCKFLPKERKSHHNFFPGGGDWRAYGDLCTMTVILRLMTNSTLPSAMIDILSLAFLLGYLYKLPYSVYITTWVSECFPCVNWDFTKGNLMIIFLSINF